MIILIGERPSDARDNGYWLFKYIRESLPHINIFYILKEDSSDYDKVKKLGNVIIYDSPKHEEYFKLSKILISTHTRGTIEPSSFDKITVKDDYPEYYDKKYIFLQHGVNVGGFVQAFHRDNYINASFSKIICGALPESLYLASNLGYEEGVVSYTGLARFDSLFKNKNQQKEGNKIIFMPTWRANICSPSYKKKQIYNDYSFLSSNYYSVILAFLNSEKLQFMLKKNNATLDFIPHPEVKKYSHYITTSNENVNIINPDDIDIQKELIAAKLLITDYSSVFFDFCFMKKPVVFYQFDHQEFFSKHYKKGYFDFKKHYFGEVVENEKSLLSEIRKNFYNNYLFTSDADLSHRHFFLKYDENNCMRVFNEVEGIIRQVEKDSE